MENIIMHKIRQLIFIDIFDKTLGKDKIPNYIFKSIIDLIFVYLYVIFNTCLLTDYYSNYFRLFITVVF